MSVYAQQAIKVAEFGGLCTYTDATNIPHFMSPDCKDIEFKPGLWKTRPGLTTKLTDPNHDKINYLKTFVLLDGSIRTLWLDSDGKLYYEDVTNNPGVPVLIDQFSILPGVFANSVTLFGREYLAFPNGQFGADMPRAYNGTNLDRVSQVGPGGAPFAADENISANIVASPNGAFQLYHGSITSATQSGNIVSIQTSALTGLPLGATVVVSGVGVPDYNGTFIVLDRPDPTHFTYSLQTTGLAPSSGGAFTSTRATITLTVPNFPIAIGSLVTIAGVAVGGYNGTWTVKAINSSTIFEVDIASTGLANSGNGTVSVAGNVVPGVHQVAVCFVTRNGYITQPSPLRSWTSTGKRVVVSSIPIGPVNVVGRILIFTPVSSDAFYYIPLAPGVNSTLINDNTTTTVTLDFSDQDLLDGVSADNLFELVTLGPTAGVVSYKNRLVWWGELNKVDNLQNLSFDGGYSGTVSANYPLGWTPDPVNYPGGLVENSDRFGFQYGIFPDNISAIRGMISQGAYSDSFGDSILLPNTGYSVRCRIFVGGFFTQGNLRIDLLNSGSPGFSIALNGIAPNQALAYSGVLTAPLASIPANIALRVYCDGTPIGTVGASVTVEEIEVFPTAKPFLNTQVRISKVEDPDSYDGVTSNLQPAEESGQSVNCCFVLRDFLYLVKDRSLFITQDNGQTEPDEWEVDEISAKVGTPSARGVGVGDEWAAIGAQSGLWYFTGGILTDDRNLAKEIQPTWDAINWQYGYLLDVKVDTARKQIRVACPMGSATKNDTILVLDYTQGFAPAMDNDGVGRKWSIWRIGANSMNQVLRQNGDLDFYIGSNGTSGKIYLLDDAALSDDGAAINGYWQSGFFKDVERLNFGYISANVVGAGICQITLRKGDQQWTASVRGWYLSTVAFKNDERQIQKQAYRMAVRFETNAPNSWMSMQGFAMYVSPAVYGPVQGTNA